MKTYCTILLAVVASAYLGACHRPTPDETVRLFSTAQTDAEVREAIVRSLQLGEEAFPALVRQLDNETPARPGWFDEQAIDIRTGGPHRATVGHACFTVLQIQLEGNWPKGYDTFHAFRQSTVAQWLLDHAGQSLEQLRESAQRESLAKVDDRLRASPDSKFLIGARGYIARPYSQRPPDWPE